MVTDTLNWTMITGTFVATGNEKYMVIGNFKSDALTNTVLINSGSLPNVFTEVCIDDVSCIPLDLPAYAGPDKRFLPGETIYIGRPRDVGIDEDCFWYKLPNTTTALDTAAGIFINPTQTSTYVVKQDICGIVKWDTVVVYQDFVGIGSYEAEKAFINVFPNPARDLLHIECRFLRDEKCRLTIHDLLNRMIKEEEIVFDNGFAEIQLSGITKGFYNLSIRTKTNREIKRKVLIE
jgi:hypothetical protein